MATQTNTTTHIANRTKSFSDRMCELTIGINLMIAHLDKVYDAGFELDLGDGQGRHGRLHCGAVDRESPQRGDFHGWERGHASIR